MIQFYTNPHSRGRIVRWMLEEVGAPYQAQVIEYGPAMRAPEFLAINPMGKVPVIVHNGQVVTECAAICAYLADAFPDAGLAPAPANRASYYRWLFFTAGPVEAAATDKSLGLEVQPEQRSMVGYGDLATVLATLEQAVAASPFIAGESFSAADVYVGSQVIWGMQFGTLERSPVFEAYAERLRAREAYQRAQDLDGPME